MIVIVWFLCVAISVVLGYVKDRPVLGVVIGLLFPFAGTIAMVMVPSKDLRGLKWSTRKVHQRECPWCHAMMPIDGRMCGHCFQRVPPPDVWLGTPPPPPTDAPYELPPTSAAPPPRFPPPNER